MAPNPVNSALNGKVCLVTGASRTLGAVIARRLAHHGAHVAINYFHSAAAALALRQELVGLGVNACAVAGDVTQADDVASIVMQAEAELGPIDILVNNVGPYVDTPFLALSLTDFDRILAGNLRATFLLCQQVGSAMVRRGQGQIVNIAATDAFHRSHSIYGLAKAGVIHLTEALALELGPAVRINALAPDLIADNEDMSAEMTTQASKATPMRRLVTRAEVAEMLCLLCSPAFAMVTGQTITMDGGRSIPRIALGSSSDDSA